MPSAAPIPRYAPRWLLDNPQIPTPNFLSYGLVDALRVIASSFSNEEHDFLSTNVIETSSISPFGRHYVQPGKILYLWHRGGTVLKVSPPPSAKSFFNNDYYPRPPYWEQPIHGGLARNEAGSSIIYCTQINEHTECRIDRAKNTWRGHSTHRFVTTYILGQNHTVCCHGNSLLHDAVICDCTCADSRARRQRQSRLENRSG